MLELILKRKSKDFFLLLSPLANTVVRFSVRGLEGAHLLEQGDEFPEHPLGQIGLLFK